MVDRETASRLGITAATIDSTLYDSFGQREVSTIYKGINQYHVVMEVDPKFQQSPAGLDNIYVPSSTGSPVPLSAFTHYESSNTSLAVAHQGQFPAVTFTFNLAANVPLGDAVTAIQNVERQIGLPATIHPGFQGTAQAVQDSLSTEPLLILAALATVYIVLGILYENYIHPITILSTLPSAGVGPFWPFWSHSQLDRQWVGIAPPAGHCHCRRADCQSDAHLVHHSSDLSVYGSAARIGEPRKEVEATRYRSLRRFARPFSFCLKRSACRAG